MKGASLRAYASVFEKHSAAIGSNDDTKNSEKRQHKDEKGSGDRNGTTVLRNLVDIRDGALLEQFELEMSTLRAEEALPDGNFDASHYRAIHHHLFQDVYEWAGEYRTVRTAKGCNWFCYPEYIEKELATVFKMLAKPEFTQSSSPEEFIEACAPFLGELNAVHNLLYSV